MRLAVYNYTQSSIFSKVIRRLRKSEDYMYLSERGRSYCDVSLAGALSLARILVNEIISGRAKMLYGL